MPRRFASADAALVEQAARRGEVRAPCPGARAVAGAAAGGRAGTGLPADRRSASSSWRSASGRTPPTRSPSSPPAGRPQGALGDAPATVGAIAHDAGVPGSAPALDGEALPSEPEALRKAVLPHPPSAASRRWQAGRRGRADRRRALRRDGRRRRQRRPCAQGGAPRHRARLGDADGAHGRRSRARAERLRVVPVWSPKGARSCETSSRAALRHQVGVRRRGGAGGGDPHCDLSAVAAPVHDRLHGHDRNSRVRARAGAELRPVESRRVLRNRWPASPFRRGLRSGSASSRATSSPITCTTSTSPTPALWRRESSSSAASRS